MATLGLRILIPQLNIVWGYQRQGNNLCTSDYYKCGFLIQFGADQVLLHN